MEKPLTNIIDYLNWRGDIEFMQDGFNEVDNLILSSLSYLEFDGIVAPPPFSNTIPLSETADKLQNRLDRLTRLKHNPFFRRLPGLFYKAIESRRYRNLQVSHYTNIIDFQQSEQFSAVVFSITPDLHFIAFRGTDDTIVGWKEDFEMSFKDEIPAQHQAVEYLSVVCPWLEGRYYLGGHSKGGNLAVYAASNTEWKYSDRIIAIYNNDGPGFHNRVLNSAGYQRIENRIHTFLPKSSIVGMMLEHRGKYNVVASNETGILQHNAFSWGVEGTHFIYDSVLSKNSIELNNTIRAWLEDLTPEQRAEFINTTFSVIQATGAKTLDELSQEKLSTSIAMIKSFNHLDFHTRLQQISIVTQLFKESGKTIGKSLIEDFESTVRDIESLFTGKKKEKPE